MCEWTPPSEKRPIRWTAPPAAIAARIAPTSAGFFSNVPETISRLMRSRSVRTMRPAPRHRWPTSELPIWPGGRPTAGPDVSISVFGKREARASRFSGWQPRTAFHREGGASPHPSITISPRGSGRAARFPLPGKGGHCGRLSGATLQELRVDRSAGDPELLQRKVLAEVDLDRVPLLALRTPVGPLREALLTAVTAVLELHELEVLDDLAELLARLAEVSPPLVDPPEQVVQRRRVGGPPLECLERGVRLIEHLEAEEELAEEEPRQDVVRRARDARLECLDGLDRLLAVEEVLLEDGQEDGRAGLVV